ncbi:MAG: cytochrome c3 family protein [Acidobacteriota bacterium]
MRLKLALVILFAVAVVTPGALLAGQGGSQRDCESQPGKCDDVANQSKKLDLQGWRGVVCFRHKTHEAYPNPDTAFAHQAEKGAECVSCHHARSEANGTPLLWKCTACHRGEGDPQNPRNREMDEVSSERAFHDLCIGCHRASNEKGLSKCKAPIACSECHASRY